MKVKVRPYGHETRVRVLYSYSKITQSESVFICCDVLIGCLSCTSSKLVLESIMWVNVK